MQHTLEQLKIMRDIPSIKIPLLGKNGQGKFAIVDGDYDGEYFSHFKWYYSKMGYAYRKSCSHDYPIPLGKVVYLHWEVLRVPKGYWRDHINRDKLDNRSCNLRCVTPSQSAANRKHGFNPASGYLGVVRSRRDYVLANGDKRIWYGRRYFAQHKGQKIGWFDTPQEAARAYDEVVTKEYGVLATTNF